MRQRIQASFATAHDLRGASVIVTRPSASAVPVVRQVRALEGEPIRLPGVALRTIADAAAARRELSKAQTADLVIFSSPAAVSHAWTLCPSLRFAARVGVAAVGAATARALRRRGVRTVLQPPEQQDSSGLLALEALQNLHGRSVVLVGAPEGRDSLPRSLRDRGARLSQLDVYTRVAPRWTQRHLAALAAAPKPRLLLVTSAFVLATLATRLPAGLLLALREAELVVSSLRLATLAQQHGFHRVHIARSALTADLMSVAIDALARHRL